jgi:resuscitation-promoting factor RpfB
MGLYHSGFFKLASRILGLLLVLLASACAAPKATQASITISITADNQTNPLQLHAGSTVQQALDAAGLSLGLLDRVEPPVYTVLGQGSQVRIVRVTEEFEIEQVEIGYSRQIIRNESLAKEEEILIQKGKNGLKEITYRRVFEDGVEITSQPAPVKVTILEEPLPEIVMVGIQAPIAPVNIPGRLFFLRDGNLWLIEGSTGNRRAILTTGDLDGRILSLSPDNSWLLFTRRASEEGQINTLWAANILTGTSGLSESEPLMVDLKVPNVIHFADWIAGPTLKVIFSTVEPRSAAPGWQANNDLNILTFSTTGWSTKWATLVEANAGGVYGWWGASLTWLPDRSLLSFARPDGLGVVNTKNGVITTTLDIVPWQARGDWAWVPGFSWGPDGGVLYTVRHTASAGALSPEESPRPGCSHTRWLPRFRPAWLAIPVTKSPISRHCFPPKATPAATG